MTDPLTRAELTQRLEEARGVLLAALTGLGERDFSASADGVTVTQLLANVAAAEHEAIREARAVAALEPRPGLGAGAVTSRPLPPQATHALAGTRYEARTLLEELAARDAEGSEAVPEAVTRLLLEGVAEREIEAARLVAARTYE
jgi:hypothetical protein